MKIVIGMDTAIEKKNTVFVWKVIITGMIVQSLDVSISKAFKTFIYHKIANRSKSRLETTHDTKGRPR